MPSSQPRVRLEKYAELGSWPVRWTDQIRLARLIRLIAANSLRLSESLDANRQLHSSRMSRGQTR